MHDFHGATTQNVAGTHHQRVTQCGSFFKRLRLGTGGGIGRLAQAQFVQQLLETLTVFRCVNHVGRGADDGHAVGFQVQCQLERRLATVLHDHAKWFFLVDDFEHVFQCEWLKIQAV